MLKAEVAPFSALDVSRPKILGGRREGRARRCDSLVCSNIAVYFRSKALFLVVVDCSASLKLGISIEVLRKSVE